MRKLLWAVLLFSVCSLGADLTGKWRGGFEFKTAEGEQRHGDAFVILKQEGDKLSGTAGPSETEQWPIEQATLAGDTITFTVTPPNESPMKATLKLDGKKLVGQVEGDHDGEHRTAKMELEREG